MNSINLLFGGGLKCLVMLYSHAAYEMVQTVKHYEAFKITHPSYCRSTIEVQVVNVFNGL